MRATAGLDADDPFERQDVAAGQEFRIFARVNVVGDDGNFVALVHHAGTALDQRRLARADGAADTDLEWFGVS